MFSQTVEYALRAIVCLAQNREHSLTTHQIAELTQVPPSYTSKVLQLLVRGKLISGLRGIGGGYFLEIRPEKLTVLQVVNAIDPLKRITTCPLGVTTHNKDLCPLHARIDQVLAEAERSFKNTTIADLLVHPARRSPLCEGEPVKLTRGGR